MTLAVTLAVTLTVTLAATLAVTLAATLAVTLAATRLCIVSVRLKSRLNWWRLSSPLAMMVVSSASFI